MISSVRGTVLAIAGPAVIIEVGGVGLLIQVTPQHGLSLRVGSEASIRTALIVREDDLSLYGFVDADELTVFDEEVDVLERSDRGGTAPEGLPDSPTLHSNRHAQLRKYSQGKALRCIRRND